MDLSSNPNTYWMSIFVDELVRCGVEAVNIAPGSRSTPLALAFAQCPHMRIYRHLDERSAGFFALGLALSSRRPVALVCTSGTAAANFHPAIIEAYYSHVPLLVLTADRPAELRDSGANQTIDQIKMYGRHVRWSVEVPTPQANAPEVVLRHLRTLAARAVATADGIVKGPVHLNFPFRKPLEPDWSDKGEFIPSQIDASSEENRPHTHIKQGRLVPEDNQIQAVVDNIVTKPRGLIICGPGSANGSLAKGVADLAQRCGYPILADSLSGIRHGSHVATGNVIGSYHTWLAAMSEDLDHPELVLRFGDVPTSSALVAYLEKSSPAIHVHIREDGVWADDLHITHEFIQADPAAFCEAVLANLIARNFQRRTGWLGDWLAVEMAGWEQHDEVLKETPFFDGLAINRVLMALPADVAVFAGNSLPVRHIDTYDRPDKRRIAFYGNRGASGIDGNVSTALGVAASARYSHVVAILGDITFYHDMNGLLVAKQHNLDNITFVVVNNDGGGIFRRLPIASHDPPFTDLFLTPHGLKFDHAAAMYGLHYTHVTDGESLLSALEIALSHSGSPHLIEVKTDSATDYQYARDANATVVASMQRVRAIAAR